MLLFKLKEHFPDIIQSIGHDESLLVKALSYTILGLLSFAKSFIEINSFLSLLYSEAWLLVHLMIQSHIDTLWKILQLVTLTLRAHHFLRQAFLRCHTILVVNYDLLVLATLVSWKSIRSIGQVSLKTIVSITSYVWVVFLSINGLNWMELLLPIRLLRFMLSLLLSQVNSEILVDSKSSSNRYLGSINWKRCRFRVLCHDTVCKMASSCLRVWLFLRFQLNRAVLSLLWFVSSIIILQGWKTSMLLSLAVTFPIDRLSWLVSPLRSSHITLLSSEFAFVQIWYVLFHIGIQVLLF